MKLFNYYFKKNRIVSALAFFGCYSFLSYFNVIQYESSGTDPLISAFINLPVSFIATLIIVPLGLYLFKVLVELPKKFFNYYFRENLVFWLLCFVAFSYMGFEEFSAANPDFPASIYHWFSFLGFGFCLSLIGLPILKGMFGFISGLGESGVESLKEVGEDIQHMGTDVKNSMAGIKCCWCGKKERQHLKAEVQTHGEYLYTNKDGSPSKKRKGNTHTCHYLSMYECGFCNATNMYSTDYTEDPGRSTSVRIGKNVQEGNSARKATDFEKKMKKPPTEGDFARLSEAVKKERELWEKMAAFNAKHQENE